MRSRLHIFTLLAVLAISTGCTVVPSAKVDTTRFFVLSGAEVKETQATSTSGKKISIRKIEIPAYLQTRSIVVKQNSNEVRIEDMNRWAEPLESAIGRVLKVGLLQNSHVSSVDFAPLSMDAERDYDVSITIHKCEGSIESIGKILAKFSASVEISTPSPDSEIVAKYNFVAPDSDWDGTNFSKLAEALSTDILALGSDIPNHIP